MTRLLFVCHGNICRSPMAMFVARRDAPGLDIDSVGVSDEEHGGPLDPRARRVLLAAGIPAADLDRHRARLVAPDDLDGAFVVAMEERHRRALHRVDPTVEVHLLTDFDPQAAPGDPVIDPWYGPAAGFDDTLTQLERAMPGLLAAFREAQAQ